MTRQDRIGSIDLSLAVPAAGDADQRRQGADRPAEADDRDRLPVRRDRHRGRVTRASASATPSAPAAPASSPTPGRSPPVLIGEDPSDIGRLWDKLLWAGASVGRSGLAMQAIAAFDVALWDLKAKRAGLPLAKLLGAHRDSVRCYNTSGGFLHTPIEEVLDNAHRVAGRAASAASRSRSGTRTARSTWRASPRCASTSATACRSWSTPTSSGTVPTALRMGRPSSSSNLVWIEEPLDAYDAEGHAALAAALDTPIATGEMLTSVAEHVRPDPAPRRRHHPARRAPRRRHHAVPQGRGAGRAPPACSSHRTSRWRSTSTSPPPTRSSPGWSTSTGSSRSSTSACSGRRDVRPRPPRPRPHPQRAGPRLDGRPHRDRAGRLAALRHCAACSSCSFLTTVRASSM